MIEFIHYKEDGSYALYGLQVCPSQRFSEGESSLPKIARREGGGKNMKKQVVIIYGPPGSGKGTQANLLAEKLDLVHFDTGKFIESVVHDPERQKEKIIKRERSNFDSGKLCTPSWVLRVVSRKLKEIRKCGLGVVFSGSPRTVFEAEGLFPLLKKLYGKDNIFTFVLKVQPKISFSRNSKRFLCSVCGRPLLFEYYPSKNPKNCPVCGGILYKRSIDNVRTISRRLVEYKNRTEPIFKLVRKWGFKIKEIDGQLAPYKVFGKIYDYLKKQRRN